MECPPAVSEGLHAKAVLYVWTIPTPEASCAPGLTIAAEGCSIVYLLQNALL